MKKTIKAIFAFLPSFLWMGVIFRLSGTVADTSTRQSISVTELILSYAGRFIRIDPQSRDMLVAAMEPHIRKIAHMAEFGLLFLLLLFPMCIVVRRKLYRFLLSAGICFLYACSDEFHQLFVPGRSGSFRDVCIDMAGVSLVMLMCLLAGSLVCLVKKAIRGSKKLR